MSLKYSIKKEQLRFKKPAQTSRNTFSEKPHWIIELYDEQRPEIIGLGECAPIEHLSPDYREDLEIVIEHKLDLLVFGISISELDLANYPSIQFGIESALIDLEKGGKQRYFESPYLEGKPIKINGLVWMNAPEEMFEEAIQKIEMGFDCLKFKVGHEDFDAECRLLEKIRKHPKGRNLQIRLDANGAFSVSEVKEKLKELSNFNIHSIEQPITVGLWDEMARISKDGPIAIALDEELINCFSAIKKQSTLEYIKPQFIILKPTLLGGFSQAEEWIKYAEALDINWWVTSALEGNIGLNAIAQWTGKYNNPLAQGLGTGMLYENNFKTTSEIRNGHLFYKP